MWRNMDLELHGKARKALTTLLEAKIYYLVGDYGYFLPSLEAEMMADLRSHLLYVGIMPVVMWLYV